jgi:hypothetical protein
MGYAECAAYVGYVVSGATMTLMMTALMQATHMMSSKTG